MTDITIEVAAPVAATISVDAAPTISLGVTVASPTTVEVGLGSPPGAKGDKGDKGDQGDASFVPGPVGPLAPEHVLAGTNVSIARTASTVTITAAGGALADAAPPAVAAANALGSSIQVAREDHTHQGEPLGAGAAAVVAHEALPNPHSQYAPSNVVTNHEALTDPHSQYMAKVGAVMTGDLTTPHLYIKSTNPASAILSLDIPGVAASHLEQTAGAGLQLRTWDYLAFQTIAIGTPTDAQHAATKGYVDGHGHTFAEVEEVAVGTGEPASPDTKLWVETDAVPVPKMRYRESGLDPWVEVGGSDEVAISDTPPAQAGIKLWVDTDAVSLSPGGYGNTYNFRNKIINGDFSVNQRAVVSATALSQYMADRWYLSLSNVSCAASIVAAAKGELPESAVQFLRVVAGGQVAAGDLAYVSQRIEFVKTLSGKTVTISFWAKAASGTPKVAVELNQWFGAGGSPSAEVNTPAGLVTISTTWQRYSVTVANPAITGKTIGTAGDMLSAIFWISAGSTYAARSSSIGLQNTTVDIWGVQVEEGRRATPFEQKSYADELLACKRFFQRWSFPPLRGVCTAAGAGRMAMVLPVEMRVGPSASFNDISRAPIYDGTGSKAFATISGWFNTRNSVELDATLTGGPFASIGHICLVYHSVGSPEFLMDLSAEL